LDEKLIKEIVVLKKNRDLGNAKIKNFKKGQYRESSQG
jgi:hypothetical protein